MDVPANRTEFFSENFYLGRNTLPQR